MLIKLKFRVKKMKENITNDNDIINIEICKYF